MNRVLAGAAGLLGVGAAFAVGCVPSAELVARLYGRGPMADLGNGNPGAANVRRTLGTPAGLLVGALDVSKGWFPTRIAKRLGAPEGIAGPMAMAPIAGHILVVGGKGAAAAVGAAVAFDPLAMAVAGAGIVWGTVKGHHAPAVMAGGFAYPTIQWLLGRPREHVFWSAGIIALLVGGRLKGPRRGAKPLSGRVLWERLWFDREPVN